MNHNGSLDTARTLIEVAAESGADMVKFQTFRAAHVVTCAAAKAECQQMTIGKEQSQFEMLKALEMKSYEY